MNVSEAVKSRKSVRKFLEKPVSNKLISELLCKASRAPSGGNLQPWKIFVINNQSMSDFLEFQSKWSKPEEPAYEIYPSKLKEPYRTSRYELGEQMYELLGIPREDKEARVSQVMQNFIFFGAPCKLMRFSHIAFLQSLLPNSHFQKPRISTPSSFIMILVAKILKN